jgi:hypothetical protein
MGFAAPTHPTRARPGKDGSHGGFPQCGLHSTYYPFAKRGGGSKCRSVAAASAKTAVIFPRPGGLGPLPDQEAAALVVV